MPDILKNDIANFMDDMHDECDKPVRMDNKETLMCDVYIWQEAMVYAKKKYDEALKDLAVMVLSDDKLRLKEPGEHTVESSTGFALLVKISKPAKRFDKDKFISAVSRKFRIGVDKLVKIAEADICKTEINASLQKRIVEL